MATMYTGKTRFHAWLAASEELLDTETAMNIILDIKEPGASATKSKEIRNAIDSFCVKNKAYPTHTVSDTIFPSWQYQKHGIKGVFENYPNEEYPLIRPKNPWGTYAYRLVRRQTFDAKEPMINPLEICIRKLKDEWSRINAPGGAKKSCYEIGIIESEIELPLHSDLEDSGLRMGGPCLSHISVKLYDKKIHMTALYRSHDYALKVPGNILGLSRLLAFLSTETKIPMGTLTVVSTYAYVKPKFKNKLKVLLQELKPLLAA